MFASVLAADHGRRLPARVRHGEAVNEALRVGRHGNHRPEDFVRAHRVRRRPVDGEAFEVESQLANVVAAGANAGSTRAREIA